MKSVRLTKARAEEIRREGILGAHIRMNPGMLLNPATIARSYALPLERVRQIISRNGGSCG